MEQSQQADKSKSSYIRNIVKPKILTTEHREEPWDCVQLLKEPNDTWFTLEFKICNSIGRSRDHSEKDI